MSGEICTRFTEPAEFVRELARDHGEGLVERGIARVSKVARPGHDGITTNVSVEASAIVAGRLVRLLVWCGELWGQRGGDEQVQDKASETVRTLENSLLEAGLEVRAGLFEQYPS